MNCYRIDISSPECWNTLVTDYKDRIMIVLHKIRPFYEQYLAGANLAMSGYQLFGGRILYKKEIDQIATLLNITFVECLLFQLTYEAFSACTSAIVECDDIMVHVRTMDWDLPELKDITVKINVYDKDQHLFDAITWAGFVGVFTGIKPEKYTLSLNYRRSDNPNLLDNLKMIILGGYPNAYFVRELLTSNDNPLVSIKNVSLVSPAYYILMSEEFSGVIIRDRRSYQIKPAPIVQTNCDQLGVGDNILYSYQRLEYMRLKYARLNELIEHISHFPVLNEETIYTTIMVPEGFLYERV